MTAHAHSPPTARLADVLVVEDDDEIRELLAEMLEEHGISVVTAAHGQAALDLLRGGPPPGIIVLDLMMPVMDGWKLRAELLADPELARIPVVVLSGAADLRQSLSGFQAVRVLTKPVKWSVLLDTIRAHC